MYFFFLPQTTISLWNCQKYSCFVKICTLTQVLERWCASSNYYLHLFMLPLSNLTLLQNLKETGRNDKWSSQPASNIRHIYLIQTYISNLLLSRALRFCFGSTWAIKKKRKCWNEWQLAGVSWICILNYLMRLEEINPKIQ